MDSLLIPPFLGFISYIVLVLFMSANDELSRTELTGYTLSLFCELPYFGLNINLAHGQFNNCLPAHLPTTKNLLKLSGIYDLNLFRLNALEDPNAGDSLYNHRIHRSHYSPYSFYKFKSELPSRVSGSSFSPLHKNIRSLKRNLENFQVHLLDELKIEFRIIGVSETKIISSKEMDFDPSIPGYVFEYAPTTLASGGVGLILWDILYWKSIWWSLPVSLDRNPTSAGK